MKRLIQKAAILLEALPYMQKFRRRIFVVKLGGSTMEDNAMVSGILRDAVFLESAGIKIIVVHGGGKAITAELRRRGIKSVFVEGLRVTDAAAIQVVEKVLVRKINAGLVKMIHRVGGKAVGFSAADHGVLETKKEYLYKRERGRRRRIDIGYVGEITGIQNLPILRHLYAEKIPVIAPLGIGKDGHVYNINADIAACEIAGRLKAEKLIFITDVDGIYDRKKNLISSLTTREVERGIRRRVISGGMVPKSRSMIKALKRGVKKTHIINGNVPHALLLEIFTDKGIGTELVP